LNEETNQILQGCCYRALGEESKLAKEMDILLERIDKEEKIFRLRIHSDGMSTRLRASSKALVRMQRCSRQGR